MEEESGEVKEEEVRSQTHPSIDTERVLGGKLSAQVNMRNIE